jgi:Xaa-Pro aminopeptidase
LSTIAVIGGYGMKGSEVRNPYDLKSRFRWFKENNLPFSIEEYEKRVTSVRERARKDGLDGVIIHGDNNEIGFVRWLSNFAPLYGSTYIVVPTDGEITLVSDSVLHGEPMHSHWWTTWIPDVRPTRHSLASLTEGLRDVLTEKHLSSKETKLGWAGDYGFPIDTLQKIIPSSFANYNEKILELKSIKSPREVAVMRKSLKITSDAMKAGCEAISEGVSENKIAGIINGTMMGEGSHDFAFFTMVVSGPKAGLKHAFPTERKMKRGDMVYIDIGANYYGYMGDMSRTLTVGSPNARQKEILDLAFDIHKATAKMMKPGASCAEIAKKAYDLAREAGVEKDTFVGGHGLGTTLFDLPVILPKVSTKLARNMTFAWEPMIVPMDVGTAVVEDDYLVTNDGVERLTKFSQKLW